ncbi:DUF4296 domain-containing protein [Paraflavisolibacter sp. H34]|uniref:DUF4296 domain-containing protein n=1 Tax=Huijunlia imazamoxiresistens TaxID=3127457 RepID=UPI00301A4CB2
MIRALTILSVLLLCWGCGGNSQVPREVLPPQKMQQVLWDLIRADELTYARSGTDTNATKLIHRTTLYQQVLRIHRISKEVFRKSYSYYQRNPDLMKVIIDSMYHQATAPPPAPPPMKMVKPVKK